MRQKQWDDMMIYLERKAEHYDILVSEAEDEGAPVRVVTFRRGKRAAYLDARRRMDIIGMR